MRTMENPTDATQIKRLLRCRKTQRYFSGGGWTAELAQAKTFPSQFEAILDCIQHRLVEVDLVLRAPGDAADLFSTPVR